MAPLVARSQICHAPRIAGAASAHDPARRPSAPLLKHVQRKDRREEDALIRIECREARRKPRSDEGGQRFAIHRVHEQSHRGHPERQEWQVGFERISVDDERRHYAEQHVASSGRVENRRARESIASAAINENTM